VTWTVADIMTRQVVTIGPSESLKACADLMRARDLCAVPVVLPGDRLAGIVCEDEVAQALATSTNGARSRRTVADVMTRDVITISARSTVAGAARTMYERGVKSLPVVDGSNRLAGIVSRSDILRIFLRSDESIRKEVANGLLNELPLLGRGRVHVTVKDGVVTLDGEVETGSLTGLLVRLIAAVPGVVGVENKLQPVGPLEEMALASARGAAGGRA
jgi:CBS domain-containing protein